MKRAGDAQQEQRKRLRTLAGADVTRQTRGRRPTALLGDVEQVRDPLAASLMQTAYNSCDFRPVAALAATNRQGYALVGAELAKARVCAPRVRSGERLQQYILRIYVAAQRDATVLYRCTGCFARAISQHAHVHLWRMYIMPMTLTLLCHIVPELTPYVTSLQMSIPDVHTNFVPTNYLRLRQDSLEFRQRLHLTDTIGLFTDQHLVPLSQYVYLADADDDDEFPEWHYVYVTFPYRNGIADAARWLLQMLEYLIRDGYTGYAITESNSYDMLFTVADRQ